MDRKLYKAFGHNNHMKDKDRLNDLEVQVTKLKISMQNLKQVLKKFTKLPDEQSQADFDNEVDSA